MFNGLKQLHNVNSFFYEFQYFDEIQQRSSTIVIIHQ